MAQTTTETVHKNHFLADFDSFEKQRASGNGRFGNLRRSAITRFAELGFPTTRQEEWRFTNVAPLTKVTFHPASESREAKDQARDLINDFALPEAEALQLVFVNGRFFPALSSLNSLPAGLCITSIAEALEKNGSGIDEHLAKVASYHERPFVALNTAFMQDGIWINVERGKQIETPVHLLFLTTNHAEPVVTHPRNLYVLGEGSLLRVIETYAGPPGASSAQVYFTNAVTEAVLGDNAVLEHYKVQQESEAAFHFATQQARLGRASVLNSTSVTLGGSLVRNDAGAVLAGEGAECALNGLYLGHGRQHIDNHTSMEHQEPHCPSHQIYKGILDDSASAVFNGRIYVHQKAQKTDAIQSSRNLLLSDTATINTQPQLEIFADDVRCTHGATIGQLNADAIFYLRSRGIDHQTARALLTQAFAKEVIELIRIETLRERLEKIIVQRFGQWGGEDEMKELKTITPACDYIAIHEHPGQSSQSVLDVRKVRRDFPILRRKIEGRDLVYLDNAASTMKPRAVIDAISNVYEKVYANVHRGVHKLSQEATEAFEAARDKIQRHINAATRGQVIFTRGTTEAINLVAQTFGRRRVQAGDEIVITAMEHHSNIVSWQMLCEEKGARLRIVPINDSGELLLDEYERLLTPKTRLVAVVHVSNVLGTINPVKTIIDLAHARGIPALVDGAQALPHMKVDMQELDVDFYAFSGHKMYGPTGIGALYGKRELLESMPPWQGGGDMISSVSFEKTIYNELPYKFEAGTPNIADAIGWGAAIDYINQIGLENIAAHEHELLDYAQEEMKEVPGLTIIGTAAEKSGVISFTLHGDHPIHPHDIGTILDGEGIAIRTGHHCAQPLMERYCLPATARASVGMYNTKREINALIKGLHNVIEVFA